MQLENIAAYGKQYTKDNPSDILAFLQSNNPHYVGKVGTRKNYRIGYRVLAQARLQEGGNVLVEFHTTSDYFPELTDLSVTVSAKSNNIVAVRNAVTMLTLPQVKASLGV